MALIKSIEVKNTGVTASYWKIAVTNIDWATKRATIVLWGFANKKARKNGKAPLDQKIFETYKFPFTPDGNILSQAYKYIKSFKWGDNMGNIFLSEFTDAEDDI